MSAPVPVADLRDSDLYQCLNDAAGISESSQRTYLASLKAVLTKSDAATRYCDGQVLVCFMLAADSSIQLIRRLDMSRWTRQAYVKAILSVYKHASCAAHPKLQAARPAWSAFCEELSAELDAVAKLNKKSVREETAWAPMHEWKLKEQELAAVAVGSASHLLVACHTLWPPLRGGDLGQLFITAASDPRNSDGVTNVLVWTGTAKPEARIQHHKTSHLKGTLVRPVPPSLQRVIKASLEKQPRDALFVSPANGQPFNSEASFTRWSNRELKKVFGKPVTCNIARHAYCTALDTAKMNTKHLEDIAALMEHSISTQRRYVRVEGPVAAAAITSASGEYDVPMLDTSAAEPPANCDLDDDSLSFLTPAA